MCKIWGAPFTLAVICFSCIWFHTESLFLHLSAPLSLSSFFLILLIPFYTLFHQMSTLKCQLFPSFRLSMKLWEEEGEHIGGFNFISPLVLSFTWIFVCLSLSQSVSVLLFLSQSFFLPILLVSPVTSLSFTLSLSILAQLSASLMKRWLM